MKNLDYKGVPEYNKPRKLEDTTNDSKTKTQKIDLAPPKTDLRDQAVDKLFKQLGATYIKGEKLKKGLAQMSPAQSIPIETGADRVAVSADRFNTEQSARGTVITYSMYQQAVDAILGKKWEIRRTYFKPGFPISREVETRRTSETLTGKDKGAIGNILEEFLAENGIAGTILAMLSLSPFQSIIFQTLTVEEGAKAAQGVQILPGIALLLEIGIKAEKIIEMMKSSKIRIPLVEQQVVDLGNSPELRKAALADAGIDYAQLQSSAQFSDAEVIVDYVSQYYNRYGGLVEPGSHLTIDHWIAYLHVAQNQQYVRGSLNTADAYSEDFMSMLPSTGIEEAPTKYDRKGEKAKMSIHLAGPTRALREKSDRLYDDILNSFMTYISDDDLCCLVSLFGAYKDTDMLRTIADLLRLLAVDLSGEIAQLETRLRQYLSNLFAAAIFELVSDIDKLMQKVMMKITQTFTVHLEGSEHCLGLLSIGWAITEALRTMYAQIKELMREIMTLINMYGQSRGPMWSVAADRRHLLGIARILEVIATRLDVASVCDDNSSDASRTKSNMELKDMAAGEVVTSILENPAPSIQLTNQEIDKYFPNQTSRTSSRLKNAYGIFDLQNSKTEQDNCSKRLSKDQIDQLVSNLTKAAEDSI